MISLFLMGVIERSTVAAAFNIEAESSETSRLIVIQFSAKFHLSPIAKSSDSVGIELQKVTDEIWNATP